MIIRHNALIIIQRKDDQISNNVPLSSLTPLKVFAKSKNMLIIDSTSKYGECYSIFNFVWEIIRYMWEQILEKTV